MEALTGVIHRRLKEAEKAAENSAKGGRTKRGTGVKKGGGPNDSARNSFLLFYSEFFTLNAFFPPQKFFFIF